MDQLKHRKLGPPELIFAIGFVLSLLAGFGATKLGATSGEAIVIGLFCALVTLFFTLWQEFKSSQDSIEFAKTVYPQRELYHAFKIFAEAWLNDRLQARPPLREHLLTAVNNLSSAANQALRGSVDNLAEEKRQLMLKEIIESAGNGSRFWATSYVGV
jgi:hypothetical protein